MMCKCVSVNLVVDRICSMIASRIIVLILSLKDGFPNGSVFVKFGKINSNTRRSTLLGCS